MLTFSPELVPRFWQGIAHVRRLWGLLIFRVSESRLGRWIARLLRRPRHYVMAADAGGLRVEGAEVSGLVSVSDDAPLERKLSFLLDQARQAQERLDALERRQRQHPSEWRTEIQEARTELEEQVASELQKARDLFIVRRLFGLAFIVCGSVLLGVANLLP